MALFRGMVEKGKVSYARADHRWLYTRYCTVVRKANVRWL